MDIDGVNAKQGRHGSELTKIIIERINVKTQKLSIKTLEEKHNNKKFKFPSMFKLFESESDLVDYNLLPKDYNEYNAAKTLIPKIICIKGWKFVMKQEEVMRFTNCSSVFFFNLKCMELFYK